MAPVEYHTGRFPPRNLDWSRLIPLLGPAAAAIARYDGMLAAIPNPGVLLSPLTTQEAVLSSRIEGTQATMGEVLEFEAGQEVSSVDRREEIQEILNYRAAMREAERMLTELPISLRVVRAAHKTLLTGVRGQDKAPGEFRRIQNWIGARHSPIEEARFIPIAPENLVDGMSTWERYVHADAQDQLVQLAILHAEFEALHPFLDGNGRVGRMLISLFLWQRGLIQRPMFYISAYLEARREAYYDGLLVVSRDDDWTGWCRFFLEAVRAQAEDNLAKAQSIFALSEQMKRRLPELTRSQYAIRALDWIFERPVFRSSDFVEASGIPAPTARRFLRVLEGDGVLKLIAPARGRRSGILAFADLLRIAEGRQLL